MIFFFLLSLKLLNRVKDKTYRNHLHVFTYFNHFNLHLFKHLNPHLFKWSQLAWQKSKVFQQLTCIGGSVSLCMRESQCERSFFVCFFPKSKWNNSELSETNPFNSQNIVFVVRKSALVNETDHNVWKWWAKCVYLFLVFFFFFKISSWCVIAGGWNTNCVSFKSLVILVFTLRKLKKRSLPEGFVCLS